MTHVLDDLELYALGALPEEHAHAIAGHLAGCASCRAAAADLAEVVARLPEAIPLREPRAALKGRILTAAGAEPARRRRAILPFTLPRLDSRVAVLAATVVFLFAIGAERTLRLDAIETDSARYEEMAKDFAHGGRTWYMAGVDQWRGMGGNLMQPASSEPAFVVFHDLRDLPDGKVYALWLISPDGKWVRGTSFRSDGRDLQMVAVGQELAGFDRCAVTVEASPSGRREGPIVMQSRIGPAPQQ